MSAEVLVDSSVFAALVTPEEHSDWASANAEEHDYLHILDLNYYEVANALRYKISEKFSPNDASQAFAKAQELLNQCAIHGFSEVATNALRLALELNITVYDAAFLSLAGKLDLQFLTLDERLAKKLEGTKYYTLLDFPTKQ